MDCGAFSRWDWFVRKTVLRVWQEFQKHTDPVEKLGSAVYPRALWVDATIHAKFWVEWVAVHERIRHILPHNAFCFVLRCVSQGNFYKHEPWNKAAVVTKIPTNCSAHRMVVDPNERWPTSKQIGAQKERSHNQRNVVWKRVLSSKQPTDNMTIRCLSSFMLSSQTEFSVIPRQIKTLGCEIHLFTRANPMSELQTCQNQSPGKELCHDAKGKSSINHEKVQVFVKRKLQEQKYVYRTGRVGSHDQDPRLLSWNNSETEIAVCFRKITFIAQNLFEDTSCDK